MPNSGSGAWSNKTHGTCLGKEIDQAGYEGTKICRQVGHDVTDRSLSNFAQ